MLADLGADVVKLEPPEGDIIRFLQPKVGDDPVSVYFTWVNAGKRSDLARPAHRARRRAGPRARAGERRGARELPSRRRSRSTGSTPTTLLADEARARSTARSTAGAATTRGRNDARTRRWCRPRSGASSSTPGCANAPPEQSPHVDGDITPGLLAVSRDRRARCSNANAPGEGQHLDVSMAEALVYTDEWTSTELAGLRRGRASPTRGTTRSSRVADGTDVAFMGDPTGAWSRSPPRISDDVRRARPSRATRRWRILAELVRAGARLPHARSALRPVRLPRRPRCAPSQQLADTPWAARAGRVRGGGTGRARRRRARSGPTETTDRRARPGAAVRRAHPCRARRAPRAVRRRARSARGRPASSTPRATSTPPVPTGSSGPRPSSCDEFRGARSSN